MDRPNEELVHQRNLRLTSMLVMVSVGPCAVMLSDLRKFWRGDAPLTLAIGDFVILAIVWLCVAIYHKRSAR